MQIQHWVFLLGSLACSMPVARADVIFSQDFSSSSDYHTYVSSPANDHQFNTVNWSGSASGSIVNGALEFTRGNSGSAWFARTTPFSPAPSAIIYSFDLGVSGNSQLQPTSAVWQVGSGFTASSADQEPVDHIHSRFGIGFDPSSGSYRFLDMNGPTKQALAANTSITWVINNSGADLAYLGPDNAMHTVGNDAYDLWADTSQVFDDVHTQHGDRSLADFKFSFLSGTGGTIRQDNIVIRTVQPVPEPTATGFIAVGFLALVVSGGIVRDRLKKRGRTSNAER